MGMFDNVLIRLPLPDGAPSSGYQTKDLACRMDTYEIRDDGSLWGEDYDAEGWTRENVRPRRTTYTGEVRFYSMDKDKAWWEFSAYFVQGQLKEFHQILPEVRTHGESE